MAISHLFLVSRTRHQLGLRVYLTALLPIGCAHLAEGKH